MQKRRGIAMEGSWGGVRMGWVDFSRAAKARAVEALEALSEKGAVDELGIGVLRDAFADAMFPGTSTLQTRAKYFTLVPCCIRYALENGKATKKGLREVEQNCCRQMWEECGEDGQAGVIGRRNVRRTEWIVRAPSELYWAGLRTLGILDTKESPGVWWAHACRLARESGGGVPGELEEEAGEGVGDDEDTRLAAWMGDFELPREIYRGFKVRYESKELLLSPNLTREEAEFLRERILKTEGTAGSLFAWCLEKEVVPGKDGEDNEVTPEGESAFERFARRVRRRVPGEMGKLMDEARAFNRLVFPARVLYNKMLEVPEVDARGEWRRIEGRVAGWMEGVDLKAIFGRFGVPEKHPLAQFLSGLREAFQDGKLAQAEELIARRESTIKPGRVKLRHRDKVEPGKWVGGGWLDYRLGRAGRILRDIAEGREGVGDV